MRHASAPGQSATIFFFQKKRWWVDASYLPLLKHMLFPGFLRVVFENNRVFYGLSWRSQFGNVSILRAFPVQGVPRNGENDLSTSGKCLETMELPKAKIRPT